MILNFRKSTGNRSDREPPSEPPSGDFEAIRLIAHSGLFHQDWYLDRNPDLSGLVESPLVHFYYHGALEGRNPSFLFDCKWYLEKNPDVRQAGVNPLVHYIKHGEAEGRNPSPYVDIQYVAEQLEQQCGGGRILAQYYSGSVDRALNPNRLFDLEHYLRTHPDVAQSELSPFEHFVLQGIHEGREPHPNLQLQPLLQATPPGREPFATLLETVDIEDLFRRQGPAPDLSSQAPPAPAAAVEGLYAELNRFRFPSPHFEEYVTVREQPRAWRAKALALYLPQFHPFPENDEWWGAGFTEWTNTTRALPRFRGHYQPHLPRDLGFYDLRDIQVLRRQAELAKSAGVYGFCIYYYWFNGKRLLDAPVQMLLDNDDVDMPFCLMWANENWTRAWDGLDHDVLMSQDYREEDDEAFIRDLGQHFSDERYIRVGGRPLFFIYRPGIIPDPKRRIARWRQLSERLLGESPLFFMAQGFGDVDPRVYGLDGATEFPPHKVAEGLPSEVKHSDLLDPEFSGNYPSYDALVERSLQEPLAEYPLIRGVTPQWDNEARRPGRGFGFIGSTPDKYQRWLSHIVSHAQRFPIQSGESFVLINAWNEWAEGAHLEPDLHWGSAYLNATATALSQRDASDSQFGVLLVGHDAHRHGAQLLLLNIFRTLVERFGVRAHLLLLGGGALLPEYEAIGPTYVASGGTQGIAGLAEHLAREHQLNRAICNTVVTGQCVAILAKLGYRVTALVHELARLIRERRLESHANTIATFAEHVVFASATVKESFETIAGQCLSQAVVRPQGIYQRLERLPSVRKRLRAHLGISEDARIAVNLGYADLRKGFDLFVQAAQHSQACGRDTHFVWVGAVDANLKQWVLDPMLDRALAMNLHVVPFTNEVSMFLEGADVFALTSREDPYPSVVLEALALGTPVVGFENCGGFCDLLTDSSLGALAGELDVERFVELLEKEMLADSEEKKDSRRATAAHRFDWPDYVFGLLSACYPDLRKVSVVIPNFNYEGYIGERLLSVFNQTYPVFEVIVLDDCSTDSSLARIEEVVASERREVGIVKNESNSGSVFRQWCKGVELAQGDYVWIAEADDSAAATFLAKVFQEEGGFDIAYADAAQVDEYHRPLAADYRYYYDERLVELLDRGGDLPGPEVLSQALSIKNQFMNVSSMLFRTEGLRSTLKQNLERLVSFRVAGDWFVYALLLGGEESICRLISEPLGVHRRHSGSVTGSNRLIQVKEIEEVQDAVRTFVEVDRGEQADYRKRLASQLEREAKK